MRVASSLRWSDSQSMAEQLCAIVKVEQLQNRSFLIEFLLFVL